METVQIRKHKGAGCKNDKNLNIMIRTMKSKANLGL